MVKEKYKYSIDIEHWKYSMMFFLIKRQGRCLNLRKGLSNFLGNLPPATLEQMGGPDRPRGRGCDTTGHLAGHGNRCSNRALELFGTSKILFNPINSLLVKNRSNGCSWPKMYASGSKLTINSHKWPFWIKTFFGPHKGASPAVRKWE